MRQVVDTETAKEFMTETLDRVDVAELARIASELEAKSAWFQEHLSAERWESFTPALWAEAVEKIFSARRNRKLLLEEADFSAVHAAIGVLLHDGDPIEDRFDAFTAAFDGLPVNTRRDLASELLHFTFPDRYWLWTRWMWDPKTRTGALPLVISVEHDLTGETDGEIYMKVGRGLAFVHQVGDGAGFKRISHSVFGTDVFLCCVYVIYAYTVLKMRMTKEFNKVMPELAAFCRRLLGVYDRKHDASRATATPGT